MKQFKAPKKFIGDLDAEGAARLITAAADVALVVDGKGVIRDLAFSNDELAEEIGGKWVGQQWSDTVTVDSRSKIDELLRDATADGLSTRWRQVNHPSPLGTDVPILYSAVRLSEPSRVVVVGRSLRSTAALQRRLVEAQQSMERDYSRLRHAETRYRVLFQMASEAVLIVDATDQKIVEANPVASELLGMTAKRIVGRPFPEGFDSRSTRAVERLLSVVRSTGHGEDVRVTSLEGAREFLVSASLFRQENATHFLIRLSPTKASSEEAGLQKTKSRLLEVVESLPDGFVVTDAAGRVLTSNRAFLELTQLASEEQVKGESLDRWLGRPGVDLSVLMANLREHGAVRLFATTLRGAFGSPTDVEISAVAVLDADPPCFGFTIRNVGRRLTNETKQPRELPRSVEQLTELVGRVSLKDLVRETTDVIERLCIEAALELTGDNRASAAEMLGLSRQSLYVKLRRYGLVADDGDDEL